MFGVWLAARATTALLDEALVGSGLTADEFAIYSVLRRGPLTPSQLAGWMSAPPTTVSSYVQRFERRGHVERLENAADRRSYLIGLTPSGIAAFEVAGAAFSPTLDNVEDKLGGAVPEVEHALKRYLAALN